jgi:hypothetical protein
VVVTKNLDGTSALTAMAIRPTSPTPASTHAHHLWRGGMSTIGVVVSVTDLTTAAGWMAGLAIAALIFSGWRKNARALPRTPSTPTKLRRERVPIGIAEATVPLYKSANPLRRVWAAVASAGLAVVIGVVSAIVIAFGASYAVITLTDLLKS